MATLILGAEVYDPLPRGVRDVLVIGERIARVDERLRPSAELRALLDCEVVDAHGLYLLPGLVDAHVHLLGGGGEGGPATRGPELPATALAAAGITTAVGLLGFDGVTRHVTSLLAKARALDDEGFTTHIYTGAYEVPVQTVTGSAERDIVLIDKVIGVGEVAVADRRSTCPTPHELTRLAALAHIGGSLSGKAGVLHLHVGDGREGLAVLWQTLAQSNLPAHVLYPTHVNRSGRLVREAAAFARHGAFVDLTASVGPDCDEPGSLAPEDALPLIIDAGAPPERVTLSSDGNGSLPTFDREGNLKRIAVGPVALLWERLRRTIRRRTLPLSVVLATATQNPAAALGLQGKGQVAPGYDADLLLVSRDLSIARVMARGVWLWDDGQPVPSAPFYAKNLATAQPAAKPQPHELLGGYQASPLMGR